MSQPISFGKTENTLQIQEFGKLLLPGLSFSSCLDFHSLAFLKCLFLEIKQWNISLQIWIAMLLKHNGINYRHRKRTWTSGKMLPCWNIRTTYQLTTLVKWPFILKYGHASANNKSFKMGRKLIFLETIIRCQKH